SATRFRTRLFTLAHDRMINALQKRPVPASTDAAAPTATARDSADALIQALAQLPREHRESFLLQAEGQLSVGEIAEITESSIDAANGNLRLARAKLRELLSDKPAEAAPGQDDTHEVEQLYRRLSALDPGRPGEWVRRRVQAYSAQQAAERAIRE